MAGSFLPPVVVQLIADTAEFQAAIDEASASMGELGAASETTAAKVDTSSTAIASKAGGAGTYVTGGFKRLTTAVIGAGVGFAAFGLDKAVKLQDALDAVKNTTNATAAELAHIKDQAVSLSDATGQSAVNIVGAYGAVEAAGYKRAAADAAVAAATKLTVVAGGDLLTNEQNLIAAQDLGITKNLSAAKTADLFTIATKGNVNGLQSVVSLLQGKVGASFAAYHQSAGEAVSLANILSEAQYSNTRALSTFVNKIGVFQTAQVNSSIINGKLEKSTSGWVNSLINAGLNVDKTKDAFTGPDGLVNGLKYLKTVADGSLPKLQEDLQAVFGATGVGLGSLILTHLNQLSTTTTQANKASSTGLNTAFTTATQQFGNELKIVWANFTNDAADFGQSILPGLEKVLGYVGGRLKTLGQNPAEQKEIAISLGAAFAAAVGIKLLTFYNNIRNALNSTIQTGLLQQIAANTAVTATATEASSAEGGVVKGGSAVGTFGKGVLVFAAGVAAFEGTAKVLQSSSAHDFGVGTTGNMTQFYNARNRGIIASHRTSVTLNLKAHV